MLIVHRKKLNLMEKVTKLILTKIIERLQDNEDRESPPMSMEEYRLTYTKKFLETAIDDEQNIIKETRNLVDPDIYSQSNTTATRGTSDCDNDSSDSEPEIVIYRNKNNFQKKKKKNVIDHVVAKYLVSGQKFGFPLRKLLSDELNEKCVKQDWCAIEIKSGLKEGRGVFAKKCIKKPHCVIMEGSKCHEVMQRNIFFLMMRNAIIW